MYILWNILTYTLPSSAVVVSVGYVGKYLFAKYMDNQFAKRMEKYKHELGLYSEQVKFDLQRKIQDFGLYTNKRHAIYPELYKMYLESFGAIFNSGGKFVLNTNFNGYNEEDIVNMLIHNDFLGGEIDAITTLWRNDKDSAINKINIMHSDKRKQNSEMSWNAANNFRMISELYLSEIVAKLVAEISRLQHELLLMYIYPDVSNFKEERKQCVALIKDINELFDNLKAQMKKELSIADYKEEI